MKILQEDDFVASPLCHLFRRIGAETHVLPEAVWKLLELLLGSCFWDLS